MLHKPCKFCGSEPWHDVDPQYKDEVMDVLYYYLECSQCRAITKSFPSEQEAMQAWENGEYVAFRPNIDK